MSTRSESMRMFQKVFGGDEGREVLAIILNRLGFFADDPKAIVPENMAVANWLMRKVGIYEPEFIGSFIKNVEYPSTRQAEKYDLETEVDNDRIEI